MRMMKSLSRTQCKRQLLQSLKTYQWGTRCRCCGLTVPGSFQPGSSGTRLQRALAESMLCLARTQYTFQRCRHTCQLHKACIALLGRMSSQLGSQCKILSQRVRTSQRRKRCMQTLRSTFSLLHNLCTMRNPRLMTVQPRNPHRRRSTSPLTAQESKTCQKHMLCTPTLDNYRQRYLLQPLWTAYPPGNTYKAARTSLPTSSQVHHRLGSKGLVLHNRPCLQPRQA